MITADDIFWVQNVFKQIKWTHIYEFNVFDSGGHVTEFVKCIIYWISIVDSMSAEHGRKTNASIFYKDALLFLKE